MLTIQKSQNQNVRVRLNPDKVSGDAFTLNLISPSRSSLSYDLTLTLVRSSVYEFSLTDVQSDGLVDNTYNYEIKQGSELLKTGYVNLK